MAALLLGVIKAVIYALFSRNLLLAIVMGAAFAALASAFVFFRVLRGGSNADVNIGAGNGAAGRVVLGDLIFKSYEGESAAASNDGGRHWLNEAWDNMSPAAAAAAHGSHYDAQQRYNGSARDAAILRGVQEGFQRIGGALVRGARALEITVTAATAAYIAAPALVSSGGILLKETMFTARVGKVVVKDAYIEAMNIAATPLGQWAGLGITKLIESAWGATGSMPGPNWWEITGAGIDLGGKTQYLPRFETGEHK